MNLQEGDCLPSVRSMMNAFGASSSTILGALHELESAKKISRIQGKGCYWGNPPQNNKLKTRETALAKLSRMFDRDFAQGYFKPWHPLPQSKELAARYNVSVGTLRKFLEIKGEENFLRKEGRHYLFPTEKKEDSKASLVELFFVTRCNSCGVFTAESERELDFLRLIYKTAGKKHYKLILLGFDESTGNLVDRTGNLCKLENFPNGVGAIISTLLMQNVMALLPFFSKVTFPVAIWWEHPVDLVPKAYLKKENWVFFNSTFGTQPGKEMGLYLKHLGIGRANYFSPYHSSSWSKDRLTGLRESGIIINEFVDNEFASPWDYKQLALKKVGKVNTEFESRLLEKNKMKELVSKALETPESRYLPWVCVNDKVAGIFLEMAEEKWIDLPAPIKGAPLIAFDNSMESYLLRIPSYDFNTEALVEQMFFHLEIPTLLGKKKQIHHILGNVVEK